MKQFGGEAIDVEFDWMVTAYRKGYEPKDEAEEVVVEGFSLPEVEEPPVESAEPAPPVSPDTTIVDPAVEVEGGEQAEVPTETLIETISSTQEDE